MARLQNAWSLFIIFCEFSIFSYFPKNILSISFCPWNNPLSLDLNLSACLHLIYWQNLTGEVIVQMQVPGAEKIFTKLWRVSQTMIWPLLLQVTPIGMNRASLPLPGLPTWKRNFVLTEIHHNWFRWVRYVLTATQATISSLKSIKFVHPGTESIEYTNQTHMLLEQIRIYFLLLSHKTFKNKLTFPASAASSHSTSVLVSSGKAVECVQS